MKTMNFKISNGYPLEFSPKWASKKQCNHKVKSLLNNCLDFVHSIIITLYVLQRGMQFVVSCKLSGHILCTFLLSNFISFKSIDICILEFILKDIFAPTYMQMQCFEFQKHENYIYIALAMRCIVLFVSLIICMNKKTGNN